MGYDSGSTQAPLPSAAQLGRMAASLLKTDDESGGDGVGFSVGDGGAVVLESGVTVASAFSEQALPTALWHNLSSHAPAVSSAWTVQVDRQGPTRYTVRGTARGWSLLRTIAAEPHRILINDTFTSHSGDVQGVYVRHAAQSEQPSAVVQPGTLAPFMCESDETRGAFGEPPALIATMFRA